MVKANGYGLIDCGLESSLAIFFSFFFPKRNKKLSENMMKEGSNSANCPAKVNQLGYLRDVRAYGLFLGV